MRIVADPGGFCLFAAVAGGGQVVAPAEITESWSRRGLWLLPMPVESAGEPANIPEKTAIKLKNKDFHGVRQLMNRWVLK